MRVKRGPGFRELLLGQASCADVIQATSIQGLSVVACGLGASDPFQALVQERAAEIFDQLRQDFDLIVVDASPLLPVADALIVGRNADGILFVVRENVSHLPSVHDAYQRLAILGLHSLGTVVNGVKGRPYQLAYRDIGLAEKQESASAGGAAQS
jgi:Mrp family chromosome partitioning ATPase